MKAEQIPLRDIHLPPPVSWWPPAPGWWMVLAMLILTAVAAFALLRLRRRGRLKRAALAELESLAERYREAGDGLHLAKNLSVLLRRVCISRYPRAEVAGLTGEAWLHFLERHLEDGRFTEGPGRSLTEAPYRKNASVDAEALLSLGTDWVKALPGKE